MTADQWTRAVRRHLDLGRLLPLGGPHDGAWLAESAARAVLRRAAREVPGVRLGRLRIALTDPEDTDAPVVPPPPGALPPGPLRVTADCAATAAEPVPATVSRLRTALSTTATGRLGLRVTEVDLRVTDLWEEPGNAPGRTFADSADAADTGDAPAGSPGLGRGQDSDSGSGDAARVADAVFAVPGAARPSGVPGRRPVVLRETVTAGDAALPGRHVQVQCAVRAGHRALDVAREVRARTAGLLPDRPTVTVLVIAVE